MMDYCRGDVLFGIGDTTYVLRLTLGALAEIDQRLGVNGPLELAEKLRRFSVDKASVNHAFVLLECLLRPAFPSPCMSGAVDISAIARKAKPAEFMRAITQVFELNFGGKDCD